MGSRTMTKRFLLWLGVVAFVILADQFSKWTMLNFLAHGAHHEVTSFFRLVLVYNPGAAFSFLGNAGGWQRWFFIALAGVICTWLLVLLKKHQTETLQPLAFSLIIGGALGNVIDRFAYGAVVDFLYFHIGPYGWPAFNVADSAITLGAILMVASQLFSARQKETAA